MTVIFPDEITSIGSFIFNDCPDDMIIYANEGTVAARHCAENERMVDEENLRNWDGSIWEKVGEADSGEDDE